jgi:hypothetical protein
MSTTTPWSGLSNLNQNSLPPKPAMHMLSSNKSHVSSSSSSIQPQCCRHDVLVRYCSSDDGWGSKLAAMAAAAYVALVRVVGAEAAHDGVAV